MQAILARLRASNEPSSISDTPVTQSQDDPLRTVSVLNNHVNEGNKTGLIDVDDVNLLSYCNGGKSDLADIEDEIEIVMATNKLFSRVRGRGSASSPREAFKNSRTRGSRVSLNSTATSEKEDVSVIDGATESDDENTSPRRARILSPMQAWAAFEETVKNIDNSNPYAFMKKPKPNFVASGTFQKVMSDMYGNTEYGNTKGYTLLKQKLNNMARASTLASRMFVTATQKGKEDRENYVFEEEEVFDQSMVEPEEPESVNKVFAKRGWKMLKRQVNETMMEQKTQSGKLNWTMLQHTLKQMTNVERTRQDLYERYGIVPTVQEDGTVICENRMLSDRARAQMYGRNKDGTKVDNKRPHSYQPPPTHLRSHTPSVAGSQKRGKVNKSRDSKNKLPNVSKARTRPVTAVR